MFQPLLRLMGLCPETMRAMGVPRSGKWPAVRRAWLKAHPACMACGTTANLEVHHIVPFHLDPSRELMPGNLMTLCAAHHLLLGHLMDWKAHNPEAVADAVLWSAKIRRRPYSLEASR